MKMDLTTTSLSEFLSDLRVSHAVTQTGPTTYLAESFYGEHLDKVITIHRAAPGSDHETFTVEAVAR